MNRSGAERGFSLMEILMVISIIGILASIMVPSLNDARDEALVANAQSELQSLRTSMEQLHGDTGLYPNGASSYCRTSVPANNEVDLTASSSGLIENGAAWSGWNGPYIPDALDPWENSYYLDEDYQCMASTTGCMGIADAGTDSSVIVSCGPNGATADSACAYDGDNVVLRLCDS